MLRTDCMHIKRTLVMASLTHRSFKKMDVYGTSSLLKATACENLGVRTRNHRICWSFGLSLGTAINKHRLVRKKCIYALTFARKHLQFPLASDFTGKYGTSQGQLEHSVVRRPSCGEDMILAVRCRSSSSGELMTALKKNLQASNLAILILQGQVQVTHKE